MSQKFNPRELITLHFGQAGIQIGHAVWETLVAEHEIDASGNRREGVDQFNNDLQNNALRTFFHDTTHGQYVPRCLMIDTEPTVIDEIRTGFYRKLFHPELLLSDNEDASNNFARGYYTIGRNMLAHIIEKCRYTIESCDNFKGYMTYSGSGGGTGSGLYSLVIERLSMEFPHKTSLGTMVLPGSKLNDAIVEPYNSIFRLAETMNETDLNLIVGNESLYKICCNLLHIHRPTFSNINRLLAPVISTISAPLRFPCPMVGDLTEIITNLVPYPHINFPTISYAPFMSNSNHFHDSYDSVELTRELFKSSNNLLDLDISKFKIMSSMLSFRGRHQRTSIVDALNKMKREQKYKWVDWCPTGFKVTENYYPAIHTYSPQPLKSILMLCNHTGIVQTLKSVQQKYIGLFRKRCFVHWFVGEGMEEAEFQECEEKTAFLRRNYEEVTDSVGDDENDDYENINDRQIQHQNTGYQQYPNDMGEEFYEYTSPEKSYSTKNSEYDEEEETEAEQDEVFSVYSHKVSSIKEFKAKTSTLSQKKSTESQKQQETKEPTKSQNTKQQIKKSKETEESRKQKLDENIEKKDSIMKDPIKESSKEYLSNKQKLNINDSQSDKKQSSSKGPQMNKILSSPTNPNIDKKPPFKKEGEKIKQKDSVTNKESIPQKSERILPTTSVNRKSSKNVNSETPIRTEKVQSIQDYVEESPNTQEKRKSPIKIADVQQNVSENEHVDQMQEEKKLPSPEPEFKAPEMTIPELEEGYKANSSEFEHRKQGYDPLKRDSGYELSAKTKEVILNNISSISPELRQRILGYY